MPCLPPLPLGTTLSSGFCLLLCLASSDVLICGFMPGVNSEKFPSAITCFSPGLSSSFGFLLGVGLPVAATLLGLASPSRSTLGGSAGCFPPPFLLRSLARGQAPYLCLLV